MPAENHNDVPLKEFMLLLFKQLRDENDKRFAAQEKAVETAFNAAKEAVIKSEIGVEKRSDSVYVTLSKLQDALAAVMPRAEAEQRYSALAEKIAELTTRVTTSEAQKQGSQLTVGKALAALAGVSTFLGILVVIANVVFR